MSRIEGEKSAKLVIFKLMLEEKARMCTLRGIRKPEKQEQRYNYDSRDIRKK